ncbi:hypothetical protein LX64_04367 [Chitinophaga skermanii]|uniref:Type IX secretion system protein PorV domain-containing protein n=1 Tax=Chitinophaga skermanii TaxID=331697 RepID=A0A327Q775_9BACT|nr:type IX secretion system outer membrane channel protein PorV [Chitinophaga skermanii]RAI99814.1 hypothetical protein LX64_04367 [Chitinophaga skermanii]
MRHLYKAICLAGASMCFLPLHAQKSQQQALNVGAPFLLINPDARTSGLGDAYTGFEPSANDQFANAAKLVFAGDWGIGANFSPWIYELNSGESSSTIAYLSGFKNFGGDQAVGASLRYMSHGTLNFRDDNGQLISTYKPREFAFDVSYGRKLGTKFSLAATLRYIRSDLGEGTYNGIEQRPANAFAGDVSLYYQNYADHIDYGNRYSWGVSFTNIGTKLKYSNDQSKKAFLPMNLRIGGGYTFVHTVDHQFTVALDINKLLVPTPPIYKTDSLGNPTSEIAKGKDPDRSVIESIFSSFGDAPGGFKEELKEFSFASGIEYAYKHLLFLRVGYFYENEAKGHRQHASVGAGVRFTPIELNVAYIMPTDGYVYQARTYKIGLLFNLSPEK